MLKLSSEYVKSPTFHENNNVVKERNTERNFGGHFGVTSPNIHGDDTSCQSQINKGMFRYKSEIYFGVNFGVNFGLCSVQGDLFRYSHSVIPTESSVIHSVLLRSVSPTNTDFIPKSCIRVINAERVESYTLVSYRNQERNFGIEFGIISLSKSLEELIKSGCIWLDSSYKQPHLMGSV